MTEKKFRPGWYENDPDPPVTICDVEKAYVEARKTYDASYSHPGWGDLAKTKARMFIDAVTMGAHDNGIELSPTAITRNCVSRWDEFREFVRRQDRRIALGREPSIGALLKAFEHAVRFSF
jgi:hypothetical protein